MLLSIELNRKTRMVRAQIDHGFGIVVNINAVIGSFCHLSHGTTIGCKMNVDGTEGASPVLGDNIEVGCSTSIIGDVVLGKNSKVGVASLVLESVPEGAVVGGNPAKIIKVKKNYARN